MDATAYMDAIEEIECGECGYSLLFTVEGTLKCVNSDCKEFDVDYKVPDEIIIKLSKLN